MVTLRKQCVLEIIRQLHTQTVVTAYTRPVQVQARKRNPNMEQGGGSEVPPLTEDLQVIDN